jgi:hypothetical protein
LEYDDSNCGVKVYYGDKVDYIISTDIKNKRYSDGKISLSGDFGYVSTRDNDLCVLYMGNCSKISYSNVSVQSVTGKPVYASIYEENGMTYYSSTGDINVKINGKDILLGKGYNIMLDIK